MPTRHRRTRTSRASGLSVAALLALAAVVALSVTVTVWSEREPTADASGAPPAASLAPGVRHRITPKVAVTSLTILRDWDRARAAAWADGSPKDLRRLYANGSYVGRRDVRMLRKWLNRGLRVRGMGMQISSVELRARTTRRLVLLITDRLTGAVAVGGGRRIELPRDSESTRLLRFVRRGGRWLLAAAYDRPASPVAMTEAPSGSANP